MKVVKYILIFFVLPVAIGIGVYFGYGYWSHQREIKLLKRVIKHLKEEYPVAKVAVEEQNDTYTTITYVLVDMDGKKKQSFEHIRIQGKVLYFDALTILFEYPLVEKGDKKTFIFPTRIFSQKVSPKDGYNLVNLDEDGIPQAFYTLSDKELAEKDYKLVLKRFWYYANNPDEARKVGIRTMHGDAVSIKCMVGRAYELIATSNGMIIKSEEAWWQ